MMTSVAKQFNYIDNMGGGHCMYYAYAISLMHYLKSIKADETRSNYANYLFARLELAPEVVAELNAMLAPDVTYAADHLKRIQELLGQPLRTCAAAKRFEPFKNALEAYNGVEESAPDEFRREALNELVKTSTYSAISYQFRKALYAVANDHYTKQKQGQPPLILSLFEPLPPIREGHFTASDIYLIAGIKERIGEFIRSKFNSDEACQQLCAYSSQEQLDHLIATIVTAFYFNDNQKELTIYRSKLNEPTKWGSDEELHALNHYLSGSEMVMVDGRWESRDVVPLKVAMLTHARATLEKDVNLYLYNISNTHWISAIPRSQLDVSPALCRTIVKPIVLSSFFLPARKPMDRKKHIESLINSHHPTPQEADAIARLLSLSAIPEVKIISFWYAWRSLKHEAIYLMRDCENSDKIVFDTYLNKTLARFRDYTLSLFIGEPLYSRALREERLVEFKRLCEKELQGQIEQHYPSPIKVWFFRFMNFICDLFSLAPFDAKLATFDALDTLTQRFNPEAFNTYGATISLFDMACEQDYRDDLLFI